MKHTNNTPKLRFPSFSDDWEQRKLGDLLNYEQPTKYIVKSTDYDDNFETPVLTAGQSFILGYTNETDGIKNASPVNPVIIFDDFTTSSHYVDFPFKIKSSAMKILSITNNDLNSVFVFNALKNIQYTPANHERHWISIFSNFDVFIPKNPKEQTAIGNFFRQIDGLIALHQRKLDNNKQLKKALLQKMFPKQGQTVPEIRFAEFKDDWEQRKLGEVGETFTGLSGKTKDDFGHGNAKYITYLNVFKNSIADLSEVEAIEIDEKQTKVQYGDVLFTTSSETPEEVGMSSVWLGNIDNVYLNSFCFGYRPNIEFNPYYLGSVLRSPSVRQKIILLGQGISRYNISKKKMMEIKIPVPTLQEQTAIGNFFRQIDGLITLHQRKLEHLKLLKKALLQQMFV